MITVYGIPSCGTVKKARASLAAKNLPYTFVDLREAPPGRAQVERWVKAFGSRALRNTSGGSYRALGPEKDTWNDEQWTAAFAADPMLIKRPVVEVRGKATIVGWTLDDSELAARLS